jgi:hypothetical protein
MEVSAAARSRVYTRTVSVIPDMVLAGFLLLAFRLAAGATALLRWPYDADLFRDISAAQRLLDCRCLADPFYRGETIWYNPLVPGLVAFVSAVSNSPVHLLYTRLGPFLNLLAPLAFYALAAATFGRATAAVSTLAYLFLVNPTAPAWASPTYSPWLYAGVFTQSLFYLTLLIHHRVRRSQSCGWSIALGLALGLTFLGHTAPALILGIVVVLDAIITDQRAAGRIGHLLVRLAIAALVSAPLLYSIVGRYRLRELNPMPANWRYPAELVNAMPTIPLGAIWITAPLVVVGAGACIARPTARRRAVSIWLWFIASLALAGYAIWLLPAAAAHQVHLPSVVPSFHYVFYLRPLACLFLGYGVVAAVDAAVSVLRRSHRPVVAAALSMVCLVLVMVMAYRFVGREYRQRFDVTAARFDAWRMSRRSGDEAALDWIRRNTRPGDVFLSPDDLAMLIVGPAGRDVVVVDPFFSNPFVDWSRRERDRRSLWNALLMPDAGRFRDVADRYDVRYVLVNGQLADDLQRAALPFLTARWASEGIQIFQVNPT